MSRFPCFYGPREVLVSSNLDCIELICEYNVLIGKKLLFSYLKSTNIHYYICLLFISLFTFNKSIFKESF